jgi:hypothetical protein
MSLIHEFFLVSENLNIDEWDKWYSDNRYSWKEKVEIDDDFIQYIFDTLKWVSTKNPQYNGEYCGLNYYGITLINKTSSTSMINILQSWISLVSNAPSKFSLKGELIWKEETDEEGYWEHETITVDRNQIIGCLNELLLFLDKVQKENYFIIHCGI